MIFQDLSLPEIVRKVVKTYSCLLRNMNITMILLIQFINNQKNKLNFIWIFIKWDITSTLQMNTFSMERIKMVLNIDIYNIFRKHFLLENSRLCVLFLMSNRFNSVKYVQFAKILSHFSI